MTLKGVSGEPQSRPRVNEAVRHLGMPLLLIMMLSGCGKGAPDQSPSGGTPTQPSQGEAPGPAPRVSIRPFPKESRVERPVPLQVESQLVGEQASSEARAHEGARPGGRGTVPRGAVGGE